MSKEIIETIINSVALTLTSTGVYKINTGHYDGYLMIGFGVGLEFFKYWGRKEQLWGYKRKL